MIDNKTSIIERLKICWYVLTKKYYLYFGFDKDMIVWNDDSTYSHLKDSSLKCYKYLSTEQIVAHGEETSLHDFILKTIAKFINTKLIKVYEYNR